MNIERGKAEADEHTHRQHADDATGDDRPAELNDVFGANLDRKAVNQSRRRYLVVLLAWPVLAVVMLSIAGYVVADPQVRGIWVVWCLLALAGVFFSVRAAATLGVVAFLSAVPWIVLAHSHHNRSGSVFLLFAMLPFAPVWLAAARSQLAPAARLQSLLGLSHVRNAIDVSSWSLLPKFRTVQWRLSTQPPVTRYSKNGSTAPALVFRITFPDLVEHAQLLGEQALREKLQTLVLDLADAIGVRLRAGDMVADDLREHGALFVVTFPNPKQANSIQIIGATLRKLIIAHDIRQWRLDAAFMSPDTNNIADLGWQDVGS